MFKKFLSEIEDVVTPLIDKQIYIYGCDQGGMFLQWYLKEFWGRDIVAFIDKNVSSPTTTILHLMAFYYIESENAVIINVTTRSVFEDVEGVGDSWDNFSIKKDQVIDVQKLLYGNLCEKNPSRTIAYFDWIENQKGCELVQIIKKDKVDGAGAHGYYPIDVCSLIDCLKEFSIDPEKDKIMDFGAGKGSGVIALKACGFQNIGGVEYSRDIFDTFVDNIKKIGWRNNSYELKNDNSYINYDGISCWLGDASMMNRELDYYNWFYFFNPFDVFIFEKVLKNI